MKKLHDSVLEIIFKRNIQMCIDFEKFYKVRDYKDGAFSEVVLNCDFFKGDHNPQFRFAVTVLNWTIFDFQIYNIHHEEYQ